MKKNHGKEYVILLFILLPLGAMAFTPNEILDRENSLPITAYMWEPIADFLTGVLYFLAGYLTAKFTLLEKIDNYFLRKRSKH